MICTREHGHPIHYRAVSESLGTKLAAGTIEWGMTCPHPLEDVSAASKIAGVLIRGRWIGSQEIHRTMQKIAASFEAPNERSH